MTVEFVDGLEDVVIVGSTARLDFFVLRPDPRVERKEGERPPLAHAHAVTLAISLDSLANAVSVLERVRANLVESGTLRAREVNAEAPSQPDQTRPASPNFNVKLRN